MYLQNIPCHCASCLHKIQVSDTPNNEYPNLRQEGFKDEDLYCSLFKNRVPEDGYCHKALPQKPEVRTVNLTKDGQTLTLKIGNYTPDFDLCVQALGRNWLPKEPEAAKHLTNLLNEKGFSTQRLEPLHTINL